jgi:exosortase D (VPLPA-CTERM-specific)
VDSYAQGALNDLVSAPSHERSTEQGIGAAGTTQAPKGTAGPTGPGAQAPSSGRRFGRREDVLLLVALLVLTLAFSGGLAELVHRWYNQEEYSHGFFIPLISLWLLWQRRDALKQSRGDPSPWGWRLVLASGLMLLIGEFTAIFLIIQLGYLVGLAGLVLAYGGRSLLRVTALPIALLLFCIPLPYFIDSQLSWRLQLISSELGVGVLRALGYSVFREGNVIDLGSYMLQVVEACSGLRYLYPLLSVGFLMAYMYPAAMRWRVLIMLSTVPITIVTNSVRIAIVGVLVERWGNGMAEGFLHAFEGWVIFLVCQAVMLVEIWIIERYTHRRSLIDVQQFPEVSAVSPSKGSRRLRVAPMVPVLATLLLCFGGAQAFSGREETIPPRASLRTFPMDLADWRASESSLSPDVERALGFSDYVLADYVTASGDRVNFYAAYYTSQRKGVSPHSPQVCIPGGGWVISDIRRVEFPAGKQSPMQAVRVVIDKDGKRALVYYWFDQRGRHIVDEYQMKWYLLLDSITRNRTDGALVRAVTEVQANESAQAADERIQSLLRSATPQLSKFIPG